MMEIYSKEHRPSGDVQEVWTRDGRKIVRSYDDTGDHVWMPEGPFHEPREVGYWMGAFDAFQDSEEYGWAAWNALFDRFHFTALFSENPDAAWEVLEDGWPVLVVFVESESPSTPGVFLKAGESAVFTDLNRDQVRFPNRHPVYRGEGEIIRILPLVAKEDEK